MYLQIQGLTIKKYLCIKIYVSNVKIPGKMKYIELENKQNNTLEQRNLKLKFLEMCW